MAMCKMRNLSHHTFAVYTCSLSHFITGRSIKVLIKMLRLLRPISGYLDCSGRRVFRARCCN